MISNAKYCFLEALRRWKVDLDLPVESRYLMRDGHYFGNQFLLGPYVGNWDSEASEIQIFCDGQWRLTIPVQAQQMEQEDLDQPATVEFQPVEEDSRPIEMDSSESRSSDQSAPKAA